MDALAGLESADTHPTRTADHEKGSEGLQKVTSIERLVLSLSKLNTVEGTSPTSSGKFCWGRCKSPSQVAVTFLLRVRAAARADDPGNGVADLACSLTFEVSPIPFSLHPWFLRYCHISDYRLGQLARFVVLLHPQLQQWSNGDWASP